MKIYIDSDYKCHVSDDGMMTEVQTNFFDGKCNEFIEGYRFVPDGQDWRSNHGIVHQGEMAFPFKRYFELDVAQRKYEQDQLKALNVLLGMEE